MWELAEREALLMPLSNVKVESKHFVPILRCAGLSGEHFVPVWDQDRKRGEETAFVAQRMMDMLSSVRPRAPVACVHASPPCDAFVRPRHHPLWLRALLHRIEKSSEPPRVIYWKHAQRCG